jgi:hypothetical protein
MKHIMPTVVRRPGRLACLAALVVLAFTLPAAAASARGYFDGGAVLADSPTTMANDGTVYALRISASDVPDEPGTPYPTKPLLRGCGSRVAREASAGGRQSVSPVASQSRCRVA